MELEQKLSHAVEYFWSSRDGGKAGAYREPDPELAFRSFMQSLVGRILALSKMHSM
jgi:hypothetical protein